MNSDYKIKIGLSCHSHEPVKYKIDKEHLKNLERNLRKARNQLSEIFFQKVPDFINNLLKMNTLEKLQKDPTRNAPSP